MDELEILIRNRDSELSGLRLECLQEAQTLTSILISIDSAKKELIDINLAKAEFDRYVIEKTELISAENDRIIVERMKIAELIVTSELEIKQRKDEIKIANKELSLANSRVFKAKDEVEEVTGKKEEILKKVTELSLSVELLPELQLEILELENKRGKIRSEISEMLDSSTLELQKAKEELSKLQKEVLLKISESNQAEYRCKKYVDELYTHMNDYEIVRSRLESIYNTKFPELDLKI